jgi:curved DNA-binding protein CbpA
VVIPALKHHPDRNRGKEAEATARIQILNAAIAVLEDGDKRAGYDRERSGSTFARYHFPSARSDPKPDLKPHQRATFTDKGRPSYPAVPKPAYKSQQSRTGGQHINLERQRTPYANASTSARPPTPPAEGSMPIPRFFDAGIASAHRATPTTDRPLGAGPESPVPHGQSSPKEYDTRQPQGTDASRSPEDARTVPLSPFRQQVPTAAPANEKRANDQGPAPHLPQSASSTSSETPNARWQPASVSDPIDEDPRMTDPIDEDPRMTDPPIDKDLKGTDPRDQDARATEPIDEDPRTAGHSGEWTHTGSVPSGQAEQLPSYSLGDSPSAPAPSSPPTLVHLTMIDHGCRSAYMRRYMAAWKQQNAYTLVYFLDKGPQDAPGVLQRWRNSWHKHQEDLKRLIAAQRGSC